MYPRYSRVARQSWIFEFDTIKTVYLHGHKHPKLISPDNWNMDFRFVERPNARRVQMDLFHDYRSNVTLSGVAEVSARSPTKNTHLLVEE